MVFILAMGWPIRKLINYYSFKESLKWLAAFLPSSHVGVVGFQRAYNGNRAQSECYCEDRCVDIATCCNVTGK